ncbi:uncharacterized protein LOC142973180 isoform X2 [Anticarsia gemmatalis]|uniref:uncharacterized protein LOC142973180 isoform X2 n=1 Tax=Anticarsia gemmatalis TaxID=129554 RepID=UPI003F76FC7F
MTKRPPIKKRRGKVAELLLVLIPKYNGEYKLRSAEEFCAVLHRHTNKTNMQTLTIFIATFSVLFFGNSYQVTASPQPCREWDFVYTFPTAAPPAPPTTVAPEPATEKAKDTKEKNWETLERMVGEYVIWGRTGDKAKSEKQTASEAPPEKETPKSQPKSQLEELFSNYVKFLSYVFTL